MLVSQHVKKMLRLVKNRHFFVRAPFFNFRTFSWILVELGFFTILINHEKFHHNNRNILIRSEKNELGENVWLIYNVETAFNFSVSFRPRFLFCSYLKNRSFIYQPGNLFFPIPVCCCCDCIFNFKFSFILYFLATNA